FFEHSGISAQKYFAHLPCFSRYISLMMNFPHKKVEFYFCD
ncbi:MAG: hypothetical protein ACI85Z_001848, partial [Rheinheimera aquimaris]